MPHEQPHGAFSILKKVEILSPDGTKVRAVRSSSPCAAKVAPTELAWEAGPESPCSMGNDLGPPLNCANAPKPRDAPRQLMIPCSDGINGLALNII